MRTCSQVLVIAMYYIYTGRMPFHYLGGIVIPLKLVMIIK